MLIKILGAIDLILALILIFMGAGVAVPSNMLLICGLILIAKSAIGFFSDFASWQDLVTGLIFLISMIMHIPGFIVIILGLLLAQKGAVSFF